jgi:hypothetical protein
MSNFSPSVKCRAVPLSARDNRFSTPSGNLSDLRPIGAIFYELTFEASDRDESATFGIRIETYWILPLLVDLHASTVSRFSC